MFYFSCPFLLFKLKDTQIWNRFPINGFISDVLFFNFLIDDYCFWILKSFGLVDFPILYNIMAFFLSIVKRRILHLKPQFFGPFVNKFTPNIKLLFLLFNNPVKIFLEFRVFDHNASDLGAGYFCCVLAWTVVPDWVLTDYFARWDLHNC